MTNRLFFLLASPFLVGATFQLFGQVLPAFFILDDFVWLDCAHDTNNITLLHIFTDHINYFFRPVVHLLFALLYGAAGPLPHIFHAATLVLHGIAAALLGLLVLRLTESRWAGLAAGFIFVFLQPVYREAMVWVSAIAEPLLAIFTIITALCWHRMLKRGNPARDPALYLGYGAFLLALGCKESGVVVWPLLLLMQLTLGRLGKIGRAPKWVHLPLVLVLGTYLLYQYNVQQHSPLVKSGLYSLTSQAVVLVYNSLIHLGIHGGPPILAALLLWMLGRRLGWQVPGVKPGHMALVALSLLLALLVAMAPYAGFFKGDLLPSRYYYMTTAILALAAGLALAPVLLAGHHLLNMAVGLAVVGMWLLGAPQAQMEVVRYTKAARPIQQFVEAVSQLKLTHHTIILSSPLRGLHVRGAVYVYHLDHPRTVWGTHKYRLPRSWGKKRALRWDPVSAHFRKVQ